MPDWLRPWLEPALLVTSVGALLGGVGLLASRLASTLPEVRATVDWWDARRDRRHAGGAVGAQPTRAHRTSAVPRLELARAPGPPRHETMRSAQLALDLEEPT